jgi:glycosyltransferase involved in cell wall biosynthesis/GT2 family glycosyltransferase
VVSCTIRSVASARSGSAEISFWVDLPTPGSATGGAVQVAGWAFGRGGARVVAVVARVGERSSALALGVHRPDVADALGEPHADWCGFEGALALGDSPVERSERLLVRATADSGEFAEIEVPIRIVPPGRPWVELERARWRGERIEIEGWLLWPGSAPRRTVALEAGGERLGESAANRSRPDVARRFPGTPPGACRGFRLVAPVPAPHLSEGASATLHLVATDGRGERMERSALVRREPAPAAVALETERAVLEAVALATGRLGRDAVVLDWTGLVEPGSLPASVALLRPPVPGEQRLAYLDRTIDLVVTDSSTPERTPEARRVAALGTVEGGAVRLRPDLAPAPAPLEVSIVVAGQGASGDLEGVRARLAESLPAGFRGEIVAAGEPGTGGAAGERARSLRRAVELARGEIVVLLDAGVEPLPGWLPPLVRSFADDPKLGAACGKLLATDGTLLEAGRVVFADGTDLAFGRGDARPDRPLYRFVRDVDCASGALFAVRRASFLELGGFDPDLGAPLDATAEFCLRLRERGWRVRYQPASAAVVADASAALAEPGAGVEPGRGERRARLAARWPGALAARRVRPPALDAAALRALAAPPGAPRALVAAPQMPQFDRECGAQRTLHLVELLQSAGWAVSYLATRSVDGERYLRLLEQRGVETYAGPESLGAGEEYLDDLGELLAHGRFELALVAFWSVAEKLLPELRALAPATRVVVDSIDLHFLREERAARRKSPPEPDALAAIRADRKRRELATYAAADAVLAVSRTEAERIERELGDSVPVFCVPLLEELEPSRRGLAERAGLLFVGNFHHAPNLEALDWFSTEIAPRLDPSLLAAHPLAVVGHGADERVRAAVAKVRGAKLVGWVPSIVPYLERAAVSVVPLLSGAGTKGKLVQALMVGTPSVATSIGIEGLELEAGRHVLVADAAAEFAAAIERLTSDPALWSRLARDGRRRIEREHARSAVRRDLLSALGAVMRRSTGKRIA